MEQNNDYKILTRKFGTILLDADVYYRVHGTEKPRPYHLFKKITSVCMTGNRVACYFAAKGKRDSCNLISLARLIMNAPKGLIVDHIERNRLDNRRCKLRLVNISQSNYNRSRKNNTGFYGVCLYHSKKHPFLRVLHQMSRNKQQSFSILDSPRNRIIAAMVHDKFVLQAGNEEFAPLNFPCFKNEPFKSILLKENFNEYRKKQRR